MKLFLIEIIRDIDPGRWAPLVVVMGVPLRDVLSHVEASMGGVKHIEDFRVRAIDSQELSQLPDGIRILARKDCL